MALEDLDRRIANSQRIAVGAIVLCVAVYAVGLGIVGKASLSADPGRWAEFGEYVGGIVNPLIAFLAFYWLTQSVLLQKIELSETKEALRDSAQAQLRQARHAARTAKLNALNSLLSSYNSDLASLRSGAEFLCGQLRDASSSNVAFTPNGRQTNHEGAIKEIAETYERISNVGARRKAVIEQVELLLAEGDG